MSSRMISAPPNPMPQARPRSLAFFAVAGSLIGTVLAIGLILGAVAGTAAPAAAPGFLPGCGGVDERSFAILEVDHLAFRS